MTAIYSTPLEPFEPTGKLLMDSHPQDDGTDDDNLALSIMSSAPRLSSRSRTSSTFHFTKQEEIWSIRQVSNGEDELYAKGKCVYWTNNNRIVKSFNFTDQVTRVFWARFLNKDYVCHALTSGISIFDRTGQHFQILLQFSYSEIYATKDVILIEREYDPLEDRTSPVLFALTHPTHELSPVVFKHQTNSNQSGKDAPTYSMLPSTSIVAVHPKLPLCLMHNAQEGFHSIWLIRPTSDAEIDELAAAQEETTTFTHHQSTCSFRERTNSSLNISSKQRSSIMHQSNPSTPSNMNFSPKMDLRSKHSVLGNLAASRLGVGTVAGQVSADANPSNIKSFDSIVACTTTNISATNKSRMINYLRDIVEGPVAPQMICEQIWTESCETCSPRANKFFSTTNLFEETYLAIVISAGSQVKLIKYELKTALKNACDIMFDEQAHHISATDAQPIESMKMMAVIDTNKNLVLMSGFDRITNLIIPQPPVMVPASSPSVKISASEPVRSHQMSSASKRSSTGERSSVGSDISFQRMFQAFSPVPHINRQDTKAPTPVSSAEVSKIEHVVGSRVYLQMNNHQRARFEVPPLSEPGSVRAILDAMKVLAPKELGLSIIARWYQIRRSSTRALVMTAIDELQLFKNWFLSCLGISSSPFEDNGKSSDSPDLQVNLPSRSVKKSRRVKEFDTNDQMVAQLPALFCALHLIFEEFSLMKIQYDIAQSLSELNLTLACLLGLDEYQNYYWLKFPDLQKRFGNLELQSSRFETIEKLPSSWDSPPSVVDLIWMIISRYKYGFIFPNDHLSPYPHIVGVTDHSHRVITLFCEMFSIPDGKGLVSISSTNIKQFEDYNILEKVPQRSKEADQRVVELMVKFKMNRESLSPLPEGINLYLWDAILNCRESPPSNWSDSCYSLIGRMDLVALTQGQSSTAHPSTNAKGTEDETLKLLFPDDIRVSEAHRMLASHTPIEFSVTQRQGTTEEEAKEETHRHLYLLNIRTMAMPVGRGALCLRTYSPVIGEPFEVPALELCGRDLVEDKLIEYSHDVNVYPWPCFHNGVAAGLTICASTANNIIDSTWINYNRPRSNQPQGADARERELTLAKRNNEHAGFLFALGLNGHLEKLSQMALHDYLCQNNDLTKLAILLGMSAAKRGSRDNNIIKVLSIHVDALLPPNSTELDVPAPVHAASIMGVGLLYQGSGDRHISKVLLDEIGRLPGPEPSSHIDRESYSLSAGLAFGLVNLCKGGLTTISSSDELRLYMLGGRRKPLTPAQRDRYFKQNRHRGEEEYINTHVTSPGGTLGLGLMYHRSNNKSVADWMRAPETQTLLEYVRPDFLILRMLSYGLIMWNEVQPTDQYIESHIPEIVSTHAPHRHTSSSPTRLTASGIANSEVDFELIGQSYYSLVAGCCMAIAMKYAGTSDSNAYKTIYKNLNNLVISSGKPTIVEQVGRSCIEACMNVMVTSLAVVMAGTGDLGVMRVCRYLRSRVTRSCVFYGSHMATHLALGILFLGCCRYSLSTSPESIAALVCSLYPIYPDHSSNNLYHLQALRHLYVLAAEPRLLIPRDILSDKPVYVHISVRKRDDDSNTVVEYRAKAPCLLPEVKSIIHVCVDDARYWKIEIKSPEALKKCLQKDHGCVSVKQKADSSNNHIVQNIQKHILNNMRPGVMKTRKSSALAECTREDRVEQYSALESLLVKAPRTGGQQYKSLVLEQIRIALSLNRCAPDKYNLLRPVINEFEANFSEENTTCEWIEYLSGKTDWTNTSPRVAHFVALNDLKCPSLDEATLQSLRELDVQI